MCGNRDLVCKQNSTLLFVNTIREKKKEIIIGDGHTGCTGGDAIQGKYRIIFDTMLYNSLSFNKREMNFPLIFFFALKASTFKKQKFHNFLWTFCFLFLCEVCGLIQCIICKYFTFLSEIFARRLLDILNLNSTKNNYIIEEKTNLVL